MKKRERRQRIVYLDYGVLPAILNWYAAPKGSGLTFDPDIGLPEGTIVTHSYASPKRAAICLIVEHPSFDVVPEGVCAPEHGGVIREVIRKPTKAK